MNATLLFTSLFGRTALATFVVILTATFPLFAQLYVDTAGARYRFAQMYVGLDAHAQLSGGRIAYAGFDGETNAAALETRFAPRITIGGMHFWGHADFFVSFSLFGTASNFQDANGNKLRATHSLGVETGARLYPWRVERDRVQPFVGVSWQPSLYSQTLNDEQGAQLSLHTAALSAGLAYQVGDVIIEGGAKFLPGVDNLDYFVSRDRQTTISLPQTAFWIGAKYVFDTTIGAENSEKTGGLERLKRFYSEKNAMNTFTLAVGPSWAANVSPSPHNQAAYPFFANRNSVILAELGAGYYFHDIDAHLNLAFRSMNTGERAFGVEERLSRTSIGLEGFKYLFDYHGFVPFLGAGVSYDLMSAEQSDPSTETVAASGSALRPYLVFGWDIRPTNVDWFILRTNLRYTPNATLTMPNTSKELRFSDFEFNFIQFVLNLNRVFAR